MEARSSDFYLKAHAGVPAFTLANTSLCALTRDLMKYVSSCLEMIKKYTFNLPVSLCLSLVSQFLHTHTHTHTQTRTHTHTDASLSGAPRTIAV